MMRIYFKRVVSQVYNNFILFRNG